jgi:hypothetical protein
MLCLCVVLSVGLSVGLYLCVCFVVEERWRSVRMRDGGRETGSRGESGREGTEGGREGLTRVMYLSLCVRAVCVCIRVSLPPSPPFLLLSMSPSPCPLLSPPPRSLSLSLLTHLVN